METPGNDQPRGMDRSRQLERELMRSILTEPLLGDVLSNPDGSYCVIIALNELHAGGLRGALETVRDWIERFDLGRASWSYLPSYAFAELTGREILRLCRLQRESQTPGDPGPIYRIWRDEVVEVCLTKSLATIKADAAHRSFRSSGEGVTWAVLDSGIQGDHPHFSGSTRQWGKIDSLKVDPPVSHVDFTCSQNQALEDQLGHGTHVAGIIAGAWESPGGEGQEVAGVQQLVEDTSDETSFRVQPKLEKIREISGVAPLCRLVSLKVVADRDDTATARKRGQGRVSWILKALAQIQEWNEYGRRIRVHGANLSVGYSFKPQWFACGQSPLCVEVDRLVRSGVVVVVAAGNDGYIQWIDANNQIHAGYADLSINDPGNAELAITVGATHRDSPHTYGVSYFSSRGPTGDGRLKPDLVAPGEKIVSCAAGTEKAKYDSLGGGVLYCELSGTSMAAPHVSGAVAAFLSVRREFTGKTDEIKEIVVRNTVDLRRERYFQGNGLLDLLKILQAV
jgi:serine protease AprX